MKQKFRYFREANQLRLEQGFAQKVVFRFCREVEKKNLQQLGDFLGKALEEILGAIWKADFD